jgi:HlyD family secretion protein
MQLKLSINSLMGVAVLGASAWAVLHVRSSAEPVRPLSGSAARTITVVRAEYLPVHSYSELTGSAEASVTANVASEGSGHVLLRLFDRGDKVAAGARLAVIDSRIPDSETARYTAAAAQANASRRQAEEELQRAIIETAASQEQAEAQLNQANAEVSRAHAMLDAARAAQRRTDSFTRKQELKQAEDALDQAAIAENLSQLDLKRVRQLVSQGAEAQQALDRASAAYDSAVARRRAAEASVSLAQEGARTEDKKGAEAQTEAAASALKSAESQAAAARAGVKAASTRDLRLEALRRSIEALRAQEKQAQEALTLATVQQSHQTVSAPFAGTILQRSVEAGDLLVPGSPVARIADLRRMKVVLNVPEALRGYITANKRLTARFDAVPGRSFQGTVLVTGAEADPRTRTFRVELDLDNPQSLILPGMVAHVPVPASSEHKGVLLPPSAITGEAGHLYVFAIENGHAIRRAVTLGDTAGDLVEITDGLSAGTTVAAVPQLLSDGAAVTEEQKGAAR